MSYKHTHTCACAHVRFLKLLIEVAKGVVYVYERQTAYICFINNFGSGASVIILQTTLCVMLWL